MIHDGLKRFRVPCPQYDIRPTLRLVVCSNSAIADLEAKGFMARPSTCDRMLDRSRTKPAKLFEFEIDLRLGCEAVSRIVPDPTEHKVREVVRSCPPAFASLVIGDPNEHRRIGIVREIESPADVPAFAQEGESRFAYVGSCGKVCNQ